MFARDSADEPLVLDLQGAPAGHRPGFAVAAADWRGTDALDPTGKVVMTPGERARQRWMLRLNESWKTENYARRLSRNTKPGLAQHDSGDAAEDGDPSERAYQRYKARLQDMWRGDNAEGVAVMGEDLPPDIAQLTMEQQQAYAEAYNQHLEENPDADAEERRRWPRGGRGARAGRQRRGCCCPSGAAA